MTGRQVAIRGFAQFGLNLRRSGVVFVVCRRCGHEHDAPVSSHGGAIPPEVAAKKLKAREWEESNGRWKCPTCIKAEKEQRNMASDVVMAGMNMRMMVAVVELLGDHFDKEKGCYLHNQSDEVIAKATGASVKFVQKLREDGFGSLRPQLPPEVVQLQRDVADLRAMFQDIETRVGKVVASFHKA